MKLSVQQQDILDYLNTCGGATRHDILQTVYGFTETVGPTDLASGSATHYFSTADNPKREIVSNTAYRSIKRLIARELVTEDDAGKLLAV